MTSKVCICKTCLMAKYFTFWQKIDMPTLVLHPGKINLLGKWVFIPFGPLCVLVSTNESAMHCFQIWAALYSLWIYGISPLLSCSQWNKYFNFPFLLQLCDNMDMVTSAIAVRLKMYSCLNSFLFIHPFIDFSCFFLFVFYIDFHLVLSCTVFLLHICTLLLLQHGLSPLWRQINIYLMS